MFNDSKHGFDAAQTEYETLMLAPHDWVPNNRKLPVVIYRRALLPKSGDLAAAFELLFERNDWPPQWRDGIFDYHHFHATAHEVLGIADGAAQVIVGGPGGRVVNLSAGDALLLPAGTGHCLQAHERHFLVVGGYPAGQQWDIRRDALSADELAAMEALPFPSLDPVDGKLGPLVQFWPQAS
ncbi:cupin [Paraburkholderia sp. D15]|uniref:cupin n=1 Tax=Paraburkholderia sp. D15 TaxID=2880218 RepID=UPI00247A5734|nr:cupin [Paraburkholderia sp. D15]WGS53168.1 cupin [Paraburkholderia sp. D15]